MAHQVQQMAFVGRTPWHGLGNKLTEKQPLEVWMEQAGLDWTIHETPVRFINGNKSHLGEILTFDDNKVLYRSDTHDPLSVVSQRYQVVQPREIMEFYRDLTEKSGFELETAGSLKGGRKIWALARTGQSGVLKGSDRTDAYVLLATACALGAWYWLRRAPEFAAGSGTSDVSTPSPGRDEPPHGPDASAAHRPGGH